MSRTKQEIVDFYAASLDEFGQLFGRQYDAMRMTLLLACDEMECLHRAHISRLYDQLADANNEAVRLKKANVEAEEEIGRLCSELQALEGKQPEAITIHPNGTHPAPRLEVAALVAQLISIDAEAAQEAAGDGEAQPDPTPAPTKPGASDRKPFAFAWSTLDDTTLAIARNLDDGKVAWRFVNVDDKRSIVLAVIMELQMDLAPGKILGIEHFDNQRPIWMASFPSISTSLGMTWIQMRAAATHV
jgi:hypothetical protein